MRKSGPYLDVISTFGTHRGLRFRCALEIFHTFGFSDDESGNGTQHGIMHYPPLDPDDDDISILMNIPYLPTIINK